MTRCGSAALLLVVTSVWAGCGSESGKKPKSMAEVGAQLEQQSAGGSTLAATDEVPAASEVAANVTTTAAENAEAGSANASASPSTSPTTPAAAEPADPSLASKRGYALTDWSNEAAYVHVKMDAEKAADALARALKGKVIKNILGQQVPEDANQTVVYQLAGHPWSVFACHGMQLEELLPALSREADVLAFWHSDFTGWASVALYRGGEEVEAVHWGGVDEKIGENADASKWDVEGRVDSTYEGITSTESYLFRSTQRKVTKDDLQKGEAFINDMYVTHDAYLPDSDQMPWFDYDTGRINSPLGAGAFAGVHAVEVSEP